jgi:diadenosine tetraphosphate (Ap4A) HIT family hydrolase
MPTNDFSLLRPEALAQLGTLLANAQKALNTLLRPQLLISGATATRMATHYTFI